MDKLSQENKEKLDLIGQLEKVGSTLRDELMETRDGLNRLTKDLDKQRKENQALKEQVEAIMK